MCIVKRGEIHWIRASKVGKEDGKPARPAIIVSNNIKNETCDTLMVVFMTTQERDENPTNVVVKKTSNGKGEGSTVICEEIFTIRKDRIHEFSFMARVSDEDMKKVDAALMRSLGIEIEEPDRSEPVEAEAPEAPNWKEIHKANIYRDQELKEAEIERNFYKKLYNELLERMMSK